MLLYDYIFMVLYYCTIHRIAGLSYYWSMFGLLFVGFGLMCWLTLGHGWVMLGYVGCNFVFCIIIQNVVHDRYLCVCGQNHFLIIKSDKLVSLPGLVQSTLCLRCVVHVFFVLTMIADTQFVVELIYICVCVCVCGSSIWTRLYRKCHSCCDFVFG